MTTKDQERKAIAQIQKILAGLNDSYVCKALEGCLEIAEENIENDFWDSYKDRYEREKAKKEDLVLKVEKMRQDSNYWKTMYNKLADKKAEMSAEINKNLNEIEYLKATIKAMEQERMEEERKKDTENLEAKIKVQELENEVIKLKARLFDLLDK